VTTTTITERADLDVPALTLMYQLATDPDLHADHLPGETAEERAARRMAAADITDHHLAAIAAAPLGEAAALIRQRVQAHTDQAAAAVAAWTAQIRAGAAS